MNRSQSRRFRRIAGASALVAALAAPSAAHSSQSYVVTLQPAAETTCEATISAVSTDYTISPKTVYTSSLCGFTANLRKATVDSLRLDPRVRSVTADGATSGY